MARTSWDPDVLGVMMAPFTGTELPDWVGEVLDAGLASLILFGHNTPDPQTTARLARAIHARAEHCVVAIDEEGGDVTRVQAATGSSLPTAWALGEVDDIELTRHVVAPWATCWPPATSTSTSPPCWTSPPIPRTP